MKHRPKQPPLLYLLLLGLVASSLSAQSHGKSVSLKVREQIVALADYRKGDADKPVLVLVHGFMQTHDFHTIHNLITSLHDEGFSILAPNLSLNVPYRRKALACEAINTHTIEDAVEELDSWSQWLIDQGHRHIILIGHSSGSLKNLAFFLSTKKPEVRRLIGISIVESRMNASGEEIAQLQQQLKQRIANNDKRLTRHQLSFCKVFQATPQSLLSYLRWTPSYILQRIQETHKDVSFIMGGNDNRLGPGWIEKLKATGKPVHVIEGSNHFMDGAHEFELLEYLLSTL
jgi:pimeloyl-ACP methyl ester carboxylesterase